MRGGSVTGKRARREDGQVLPLIALFLVVVAGLMVLVVDIGRVYVAQQQLQNAVNAAALAAGQALPNSTNAYSEAVAYSGVSGKRNALFGYDVSAAPAQVTFECLSHGVDYTNGTCPTDTSGDSCHPTGAQTPPTSTCNAVYVTEQATVKSILGGLIFPSWTIKATAIAAARGGTSPPLNVFVILDNTVSMMNTTCSAAVSGITSGQRKLDCAKAGMRTLLQTLDPCSTTLTSCGAATANTGGALGANVTNPLDEVGVLVTPAMTMSGGSVPTASLNDEINCDSNATFADTYPTWSNYTYSSSSANEGIPNGDIYAGFEAIGLSSDYRTSDTSTTLNTTSNASDVVDAVNWNECTGDKYPGYSANDVYGLKDIGGQGSALAGAITEAQYLLQSAPARTPAAQNVIVIESDGDLTTGTNPCLSALEAATEAKDAGTDIYSIEYDSAGSFCPDTGDPTSVSASTDNVPIPANKTNGRLTYGDSELMQDMATGSNYFFDQTDAGDLTTAFQAVGNDLSGSRLIADCTQAPPAC
jgi:Flp pilus assembly protein TadG